MTQSELYSRCAMAVLTDPRGVPPQDVEDIIQDVWIACMESRVLEMVGDSHRIEAEASRIAGNICSHARHVARRQRARVKPLSPTLMETLACSPDYEPTALDSSEIRDILKRLNRDTIGRRKARR